MGGGTARAVFLSTVSVGRHLRRAYDEALEPFDLTLDQTRILEVLRRAGPEGLAAEDFRGLVRQTCVNPDCGPGLEKEGWLEVDHEGNRRITGPGRQRLAELDPVLEEVDDRLSEHLGADEVAELRRILAKIPIDRP